MTTSTVLPRAPMSAPDDRRPRRRASLMGSLTWVVLWLFIVVLVASVAVVVIGSFADRTGSGWLPASYTAKWYAAAWQDFGVGGLLGNTVVVAIVVVVISLAIGIPTAYVLARQSFAGKRLLLGLFLLPQVIPTFTYAIPLATLVYALQLNNTLVGVIIVNLVPSIPFAVLVLIPFVEQIDPRVEQAARMSGAGTIQVFGRILAPLMVPGLLAAGVLILVRVVGQFELTFLVAGPDSQTLVIALYAAATQSGIVSLQEIETMAVVYALTTLILLMISLRFVDPTTAAAGGRTRVR
ncbi:ABC transporter permease subunit [Pseudolysinimonas kribbensis]|uniref:Spermidine/putrescine ABC transporter permease n=1 Tax=Pseudolysinimonas kribbensis TaxID=433641 RepID=A0ABQ6K660_9MICO|nr:ABC transporter permease subunit [Pseudolysinimonas kribbensis]GMA96105.1 spermidine/putrescine ABC transporter permease [Pseudolysinimonas kribbensis]